MDFGLSCFVLILIWEVVLIWMNYLNHFLIGHLGKIVERIATLNLILDAVCELSDQSVFFICGIFSRLYFFNELIDEVH